MIYLILGIAYSLVKCSGSFYTVQIFIMLITRPAIIDCLTVYFVIKKVILKNIKINYMRYFEILKINESKLYFCTGINYRLSKTEILDKHCAVRVIILMFLSKINYIICNF